MIETIVRHPARVLIFEPGDVIPQSIGAVKYPSGVSVAILPLEEENDDAEYVETPTKTKAHAAAIIG